MTLDQNQLRAEVERLEFYTRKAPDSLDACVTAFAARPGKPDITELQLALSDLQEQMIAKLSPEDARLLRLALHGQRVLQCLASVSWEWSWILHHHDPDEEDGIGDEE